MNNLNSLPISEVHKLWQKYIKKPVPKLKKNFLTKYIYWYMQAKENDIPLRPFFKLIEKTAQEFEQNKITPVRPQFEPGTKFIREYKGQIYEVEVIKNGFLYKGEVYKTLSAIARKITCASWNGIVFFRGNNGTK